MKNYQAIRLTVCIVLTIWVFTVTKTEAHNPNSVNGTNIVWAEREMTETKSKVNTKFESQGLGAWYDFAVSWCNTVIPTIPYKLVREVLSEEKTITDDIGGTIKEYFIGVSVVAAIGILFILLMPIVGCCFCCCRLCNNCGGEMSQKDRPNNACKRATFGVVLSIITLLMFTGVLLTFVTNDHISKSLTGSKPFVDSVVDEALEFINNTFKDFNNFIDIDFAFVAKLLTDDIGNDGLKIHIGDPLVAIINKVALRPVEEVKKLSTNSQAMQTQLEIISNNTKFLRTNQESLAVGIQEASDNLTSIKNDCNSGGNADMCTSIDTSQLATGANFSNVPNVTVERDNIADINFVDAAEEGLKTLRNIPGTMINKTSETRGEIIKLINNGTTTIKKILKDARKTVDDGAVKALKDGQKQIHDYTDTIDTYDKYRWYACIGLTCLLLLIVVLLALGLMCGICGHDKDATPTTRGTVSTMGGNCLMAAVGFCFLFAAFFMLLTTICFLLGTPIERLICQPIQSGAIFKEVLDNPAAWKDGKLPLAGLLKADDSAGIKIGDLLDDCRKNEALYRAIQGEKLYNVTKELNIRTLLGDTIDNQLDNLKVNLSDQTILTNASRQSLKDLNASGVDAIDFDSFLNETKKGITTTNLTEFATQVLDELAGNFSKKGIYDLGNRTLEVANDLRSLDANIAQPMKVKADELEKNVEELRRIGGDLSRQATNALNAADNAEKYLHNQATSDINTIATEFADRVLGWGFQFTDHIVNLLNTKLGRCKPLTNVYDGTVVYFCNDLLYPFNGFWLSIGFILFFFIPAIIFGVKLAKHYRRMKYESDFDQEGYGGEAIEMGQPPAYTNGGAIGQEKKVWANPQNSVYPQAPSAPPQY